MILPALSKKSFGILLIPLSLRPKNFALPQDIPNHILEYYLSTMWIVDGVEVKSLIRKKMSLFDPHITPWGKMKSANPYCTSAWHAQSYSEYQMSPPENVDVVHMTNFTEKQKNRHISDPKLTLRDKMKIPKPYSTSTRHSKSSLTKKYYNKL